MTALQSFEKFWKPENDGSDPIERIRAFCSFSMVGQDWLDVEPFFDAVVAERDALLADAERFRLWATDPYGIFQAAWKAWNAFGDWREAFDSATGASSGNHDRHR